MTNRHERRARAAQDRNRASRWMAGRPGEVHIDGGYDEVIRRAGGEQNVVTVIARLGEATLKAAIALDMIDATLDQMRKVEAQQDKRTIDPRQGAMSFVLDAMKKNQHLTRDTGSAVVATLFWLACTKEPQAFGDQALQRAREGGAILSWVITEGGPGRGNNWRLILDGLPEDAAHVPVPEHPMPGTPGGPTLNS